MNRIIWGLCLMACGLLVGTQVIFFHEQGVSEQSSADADASMVGSDLLKTILKMRASVQDEAKFTETSCATAISELATQIYAVSPQFFDQEKLKGSEGEALKELWSLRQDLRKRLQKFYLSDKVTPIKNVECVTALRRAFRYIRYAEDYLILWSQRPKAFDEKTDVKALSVLAGDFPQLMLAEGERELTLQSGDALMSRGNAFTSAAISRIGTEDAQFSHLATVYIDAEPGTQLTLSDAMKDDRVKVIEAHIEVGSFHRPFREYLTDGNARIVQFRYMQPERAHYAAKSIFDIVDKYQKKRRGNRPTASPNDNPPYDFKMDMQDEKEIFCSEGTAIGYRRMKVQLPTFPSTIEKNALTEGMGIRVFNTFAPSDMEVEPQFELVSEWRDPRKLAALHKKDAILASLFRWMEKDKYEFHPDGLQSGKALFAWTARQFDLGFVQERLPKHMSPATLQMVFVLDEVGAILHKQLDQLEAESLASHDLYPSFAQQNDHLEAFKKADEAVWKRAPNEAILHDKVRPPDPRGEDPRFKKKTF